MKYIFITGEMRSGTTFLCNFLNSQKEMVLYSDLASTFFMESHDLQIKSIDKRLTKREKNVLLSTLIQGARLQNVDISHINRQNINTWWNIFCELNIALSENKRIKYVGTKRTREELYLKQLLDKNIKIIYIVRDPRDVMLSNYNRHGDFNLYESISYWEKSVRNISSLKVNPNLLIIRFEDLIIDSVNTVNLIGNFLDIDISINKNKLIHSNNLSFNNNSSFGDINQLFDSNAVERWKKKEDCDEIYLTEFILKEFMNSFGYSQSGNKSYNIKHAIKGYRNFQLKKKIRNYVNIIFNN